ncbi:flagellar hook-length control protein FliK [Glycocaulis abyssi]|uniref:Flagellar hook-length control protein FliK n=1 Tax=Glycocaulis abyssi TaxID=1433403 RepID=A0ABV9NDQ9_9PROT
MLPGFAIADMLFANPATGRGDAARASGGEAEGAGDFEALLAGEAGDKATSAKSSASQSGGQERTATTQVSAEIRGQGAPAPSPVPEPDAPELLAPELLPGEDDSETATDTGAAAIQSEDSADPDSGETIPADESEPSAFRPDSLFDGQPPAAGVQTDTAEAGPSENDSSDDASDAAGKGEDAKSAGAEPAAPAAPAKDAAPPPASNEQRQTTEPRTPQAEPGPTTAPQATAQPATGTSGQGAAQPGPDAAQQGAAERPAPPPAPASDQTGVTRTAEAQQAGTAQGAQQAKTDLAAQPAKADGEVSNAAAIRREMERGGTRGGGDFENARVMAEKAESASKEAPAPQRTAMSAPALAPAAASTPQPAIPAAQSMAAMLTALQTGLPAQELPDLHQSSEGGEIRLESSSALLARNESASVAGTRTTSAMPHLRMASGHVAELGQMIARRFADGSRSFDIRLDPPDLGRVQVRLEIGADRSVQAMLTADKPEALAELQRNARELEKALADAGLDLGENAISFALSEGGGDEERSADREEDTSAPEATSNLTLSDNSTSAPASRYGFLMAGRAGVDMRI